MSVIKLLLFLRTKHSNIWSGMKTRISYKSTMFDLSDERCIREVMGRVFFTLMNQPFWIVNIIYPRKYWGTRSRSNISKVQTWRLWRQIKTIHAIETLHLTVLSRASYSTLKYLEWDNRFWNMPRVPSVSSTMHKFWITSCKNSR